MEFLPSRDEQQWLVSSLAGLIAGCGRDQFVGMPIVEPTPRFFPDPWSFSHEGLDRLVRRLMQLAGMDGLDVRIGTFVQTQPRDRRRRWRGGISTAGMFMGISEGCCLFGFNEETPADPELMAGVMSHEVAHAYRQYRQLPRGSDSDEEEWLTDLTACYLGFGILAANNSFRWRTAAWSESVGYLSPQAFAFLLGVQMVMQGLSSQERTRLLKHLQPNQAAFTRAAVNAIVERQTDIMKQLRLEPRPNAEPMKDLDDILRPLPEYVEPAWVADPDPAAEVPGFNAGQPVFAVRKSRAYQYSALGLALGLAVGVLVSVLSRQPLAVAILVVMGSVAGGYYGSRLRYQVCSDPDCEAVLPPGMSECPNCSGHIAGSIRHPDDRLEAREAYYEKMRKQEEVSDDNL